MTGTILPQKLSGLPAPGALSLWTGNARRPEGIVLVAVSLLRGGVSCNKGCIGWTTIP